MSDAAQPVTRGDYDWNTHWSAFRSSADNNPANEYRGHLVFDHLGPMHPGQHLLDIGSGQGELALLAASRNPGLAVLGLEYSAAGVDVAKREADRLGLRADFIQCDLLATTPPRPSEAGWADLAVCSEVLEHVDDPARLLHNARGYLKPGCRIVVTVPAGPRSAFDRHIGHRRHFDPKSLRRVLLDAGLRDIRIQRAGFPFHNLYKLTVMARGRSLMHDIDPAESTSRGATVASRFALGVFRYAFRLNLDRSPFGWQLVATAENP